MSFTLRLGSRRLRQTSHQEDRLIVRNKCVQPTASSVAIQAQVAPSLGAPVSSQTIRRYLAEGHLGSRCPFRVLPLTIDASFWSSATHEETELQRNGTRSSLATNPDSISAVMTIVCSCVETRGERLNPDFILQRHTAPTVGVMEWGVIAYNTWSPLVLICGTITTQRDVRNIHQTHVLPLMQRLPGAIFQ
ncbi:transposable element Tcb2 transposase [Trichonephila clavipes]|nr:transposable element Tcb2 transposase [Trichonephila clavipes]